jgi:hypothetical protein
MEGRSGRLRTAVAAYVAVLVVVGAATNEASVPNPLAMTVRAEGPSTVPRLTTVLPPPEESTTSTTTTTVTTTTTTTTTSTTVAAPAPTAAVRLTAPTTGAPPATTAAAPPATTATSAAASDCHPSYQGACVPVGVSDVDCGGGSGDGPAYVWVKNFRVVGPDVYRLDADNDGIACEG